MSANLTPEGVARLMQIGNELGRLVKPEAFSKWMMLSIPELNGRTPLEMIEQGLLDDLYAYVRTYGEATFS